MSIIKTTPDGVSEELAQITSAGQFTATNPPQPGIIYTNSTAGAITTTYPSSMTWLPSEQKTYLTSGFTVTAGASVDAIQTAFTTGVTNILAWSTTVLIPPLSANITLNYPSPVNNIGKTITLLRTGVPNTFSITHTPAVGTLVFQNSASELVSQAGSITIEATSAIMAQQVSNNGLVPVLAEFGEVVLPATVTILNTNTSSANTASILSFTLPTAGTWEVTAIVRGNVTAAGRNTNYGIYDATPTLVPNSETRVNNYAGASGELTGTSVSRVVTVGSAIYQIRAWDTSGSGATTVLSDLNGRTKVTFAKIANFTPLAGQVVESTLARQTTIQGIPVSGTPLNFENIDGATPISGGTTFALTAGRQYYLQGASGIMSGVSARFGVQFFNLTTGLFIGTPATYTSPNNAGAHSPISGIAVAKIAPTVATQIQLRIIDISGTAGIIGGSSLINAGAGVGSADAPTSANWVKITQEGTSAVILSATPNVIRFLGSGTYTPTFNMKYATVQMVGGGGGGGGALITTTGQFAVGAGGGSGGYLSFLASNSQFGASQTITIGAGTSVATGAGGATGGSTIFGTMATVAGGVGGSISTATANNSEVAISAGGIFTLTTGNRILALVGQAGAGSTGGSSNTGSYIALFGGAGGSNPLGSGGVNVSRSIIGVTAVDGLQGTGFGSGGSGSGSANGSPARNGGVGNSGIVIIIEYF